MDLAVSRIGVVRLAGSNESRGTLSRETLLGCGRLGCFALFSALAGTSSNSSSSSSPSETKSLVGIPRKGRGMRRDLPLALAIFRKSAGQFPLDSDVTLYHRFKDGVGYFPDAGVFGSFAWYHEVPKFSLFCTYIAGVHPLEYLFQSLC